MLGARQLRTRGRPDRRRRPPDLFYDRLFYLAPSLRRMFPTDMRRTQKRKLMLMIADRRARPCTISIISCRR